MDSRRIAHVLRHEFPLVVFTVLAPAAAGVALSALLCVPFAALAGGWDVVCSCEAWCSAASLALVTGGMLASVLHLAKPHRAPFSILHWKTSWLSREILAVGALWATAAAWTAVVALANRGMLPGLAPLVINAATVVAGCVLVAVIAAAYRTEGQPAWNGPDTTLEMAACAIRVGVPAGIVIAEFGAISAEVGAVASVNALSIAAAAIGVVAATSACMLDKHACVIRRSRLNDDPAKTRVREGLRSFNEWGLDRTRILSAELAAGIAFSACALFATTPAVAAVCAVLTVAIALLQMMLRVCFYGLFTTARTVPRLTGIS